MEDAPTNTGWAIGQYAYVPFWVLLDYERTPHDPFRRCRLVGLRLANGVAVADVEVAVAADSPPLLAYGLALDLLIAPADLPAWQRLIADWFLDFTPTESL